MERIAEVLQESDQVFSWATKDGKLVNPASTYSADPVQINGFDAIVCVESMPSSLPVGAKKIVVDHHRPGDPGYDKGPSEFWQATSLGQIYKLLLLPAPPKKDLVLAAMDHCFTAAIRDGMCPGIASEDVKALRITNIAKTTGTSEQDVLNKVQSFDGFLNRVQRFEGFYVSANEVTIGSQKIKDMRHIDLGTGYSLDLLAAQTSIALCGGTALLRHRDAGDAREKNTIYGRAEPMTIIAFKDNWAASQGLVEPYGVPERSYAGAYAARTANGIHAG